jgi:hypothetical protein
MAFVAVFEMEIGGICVSKEYIGACVKKILRRVLKGEFSGVD